MGGDAQHPFLHHQRLPPALQCRWGEDRKSRGSQRLGACTAFQRAVVVLEPNGRASGVFAESPRRSGGLRRSGRLNVGVAAKRKVASQKENPRTAFAAWSSRRLSPDEGGIGGDGDRPARLCT